MSAVALHPPLLAGPPDGRILHEPLTDGPRFIVKRHPQRHGRLWHRPRSGYLMLCEWAPDRLVTIWHLWCGTSAFGHKVETSDDPPIGDAVCATCEGRALGVGQVGGSADYRTLFTPRYSSPPLWCPGSGRSGLWVETGRSVGRCCVCGAVEPIRCMGGWCNGDLGIVRHRPMSDLLAVRCDMHAWRELVRVGDGVACRCGVTA